MRVLRSILFLLVPLLLLAGCASGRGRNASDVPRTTLRVDNRSWSDVNVYAVRGSSRVRLGDCPATSSRVLNIPTYLVSGVTTLRFLVDPIGSNRTPISEEITVSPGEEIEIMVPNTP